MVAKRGKKNDFGIVEPGEGGVNGAVNQWIMEVEQELKREKDFRDDSKKVVKLYEGKEKEDYLFNIVYSNTETLAPALYSTTPRPKVKRRFKDDDPLGFAASKVVQRTLEFLMDSGQSEYTEFDELMKQATLEALVPGRGVTRFKYDANIEKKETPNVEVGGEINVSESVTYETVCGEEIPWDRFVHGFAKKWEQVPWVCYIHFMTREELVKNFGEELGNQVRLTSGEESKQLDEDDQRDKEAVSMVGMAAVYEIWDKQTRRVMFVSPGLQTAFLRELDDPLRLTGFYPSPRPMAFTRKISSLIPVSLYTYYCEQAKELNRLTRRINRIVEAMKVRGFYDSTIEGMDNLMRQDDNALLPCENVASLIEGKSLENSIWLMPIDKLVGVLQQLYLARESVKQIIYEITGISDILRGSSAASESATAQKIKNEWGNLRLRRWQREVQRYARDSLRIMAEIAVSQFGIETLQQMTGLPFPTNAQKQSIQQQAAMVQQAVQTGQMNPEQAQQLMQSPEAQEYQQILSQPSWEDITSMLQNDALRSYKIDIETNSTLDADVSEDKANMTEFINALNQFFLAIQPMMESGSMPFDVAKAMLLQMTRRFNFGEEVEDQLAQMTAPQPQGDSAEQEKLAEERMQMQQEKAQMQMDAQKAQFDLQTQQQELEHQKRMMQLELQYMKKMAQLQQLELQMKTKAAEQSAADKAKPKPGGASRTS